MSQKAFWDERYDRPDYLFGEEPNDFIRAVVPPAGPGMTAFAPADGEGRNGVWLARQGYAVTSVDVSQRAVEKARSLAARYDVAMEILTGSLFDTPADDRRFDLVVVSFMHFRDPEKSRFHALVAERLKPGGLLVFECYHKDQMPLSSGGPKDEAMLLTRDDLVRDFSSLDILLLQDVRRLLCEGDRHRGEAATVQMIARKPQ